MPCSQGCPSCLGGPPPFLSRGPGFLPTAPPSGDVPTTLGAPAITELRAASQASGNGVGGQHGPTPILSRLGLPATEHRC